MHLPLEPICATHSSCNDHKDVQGRCISHGVVGSGPCLGISSAIASGGSAHGDCMLGVASRGRRQIMFQGVIVVWPGMIASMSQVILEFCVFCSLEIGVSRVQSFFWLVSGQGAEEI